MQHEQEAEGEEAQSQVFDQAGEYEDRRIGHIGTEREEVRSTTWAVPARVF